MAPRPSLAGRALHALGERYRVATDRAATRFFTGTREVETPFGFRLRAGRALANRMMLEGTFEPEETAILRRELEHAAVFIDVGANVGLYTCLARHLGRHAIAVEPQPQNLACLYSSLRANGWTDVEVFPLGLAAAPGVATLYGASGPSASLLPGWANLSRRHAQTIALSTLDILVGDRFAGEKMLVKVDVEGAESGVLRGAERLLRREPRPSWLVEICLDEFHPGRPNPHFAESFDRFWTAGYRARQASAGGEAVHPADVERWVAAGHTDGGVFNYLFEAAA